MKVIKKTFGAIVYAIRGTAEMIGMLVFLLYLVGRTVTGEWALAEMVNGSIDKNGVVLTIVLFVSMFAICGLCRYEIDRELDNK